MTANPARDDVDYQAAEARLVSDTIKKEGGIPCMITDSDLPK